MKIAILDNQTLLSGDITPVKSLASQLNCYDATTPEQVLKHCHNMDVVITNKVVLNQQTLTQLPHLKLICIAATGTNNVDLAAAKSLGIEVCNVAGYSTNSVAQHTFSMIFNLLGNQHRYYQDCKSGQWQQSEHFCFLDYPIDEVAGKTMAIIGYGNLGKKIAQIAQAFDINVLIAERKGAQPRAGRVSFEHALNEADIISLHCPLTDDTHDLIGEPEFAMMKQGAILINGARGGVVNEQALVDALTNQRIAGAGVDVLSKEPADINNPLINYQGENLLLTPHIAWASQQSVTRLLAQIALNIDAFKRNEKRNCVNA